MRTFTRRLTALAMCASCWVAPRALGDPEFRAFWADAFSVGFKSQAQITDMINRASAGGYNVIVAEVLAFHDRGASGHGAYWNSAIVPRAADISGLPDPLATLVSQAHAGGLQVHAWIVPYRISSTWPPSGNALLAAHPEWTMTPIADMGDGPAPVGGYYTFDPGSPDAQEYLTSIVRELVTNYAIDGINLDYIRYVQTDAGYPADEDYEGSSLERFRRRTGFNGTPAATGVASWNDFRRRTIDEFVRRLRVEIASITSNPRQPVWLTADLICFGNAPASFESADAYVLHQNWRMWMERGWLDGGIPMNYKREANASQAAWYRNWVQASLNWRYSRLMMSGQANYLNRRADSVTQLAYALNAGADGTCNFSYDATADENLDGAPETDWGWYPYVHTNLFAAPAEVPDLPWRHADTAVEGSVWGRVIDQTDGTPAEFALVQVGELPPVETDGNGYYVVTLVPAAGAGTAYDVTAMNGGCPAVVVNDVVVPPGGLARLDVDLCQGYEGPGDMDDDGDVDADDFAFMLFCMQGPGVTFVDGHVCLGGDSDADSDLDLHDLAFFQQVFGQ